VQSSLRNPPRILVSIKRHVLVTRKNPVILRKVHRKASKCRGEVASMERMKAWTLTYKNRI